MLSLLLVTSMAMAAPNDYYTASAIAIKEKKMLFVWRGIKDDYIIKRYPNAVHCFDPSGLERVNLIRKGVIVSLPNDNNVLVVKIETESIGELVFKLIEMPVPVVKVQGMYSAPVITTEVVKTQRVKVYSKPVVIAPVRTFFLIGNSRSQCSGAGCSNR